MFHSCFTNYKHLSFIRGLTILKVKFHHSLLFAHIAVNSWPTPCSLRQICSSFSLSHQGKGISWPGSQPWQQTLLPLLTAGSPSRPHATTPKTYFHPSPSHHQPSEIIAICCCFHSWPLQSCSMQHPRRIFLRHQLDRVTLLLKTLHGFLIALSIKSQVLNLVYVGLGGVACATSPASPRHPLAFTRLLHVIFSFFLRASMPSVSFTWNSPLLRTLPPSYTHQTYSLFFRFQLKCNTLREACADSPVYLSPALFSLTAPSFRFFHSVYLAVGLFKICPSFHAIMPQWGRGLFCSRQPSRHSAQRLVHSKHSVNSWMSEECE